MIDFMGKKFYFFGLSLLLITIGIIVFFVNGGPNGGFNLDIQFQGGTIVQIQTTDKNFSIPKAESIILKAIKKKATVQTIETLNQKQGGKLYFMSISVSSKDTLVNEEQTTMLNALKADSSMHIKKIKPELIVNNVQPSIGAEILKNGIYAIIISSLLIIIYIWIRFSVLSGPSAGVMAILALLHDILLMLSVYAVFRIKLNEAFIAAVLTVIGYSMNDTIIIYDRIRENSKLIRRTAIAELVNKSITQTLNRSINTVVTVLICIVTVFLFAAYNNITSITEFTAPLIIGLTSGCYSSIFIASPLWVMWKESQYKRQIAASKSKSVKPARAKG